MRRRESPAISSRDGRAKLRVPVACVMTVILGTYRNLLRLSAFQSGRLVVLEGTVFNAMRHRHHWRGEHSGQCEAPGEHATPRAGHGANVPAGIRCAEVSFTLSAAR